MTGNEWLLCPYFLQAALDKLEQKNSAAKSKSNDI